MGFFSRRKEPPSVPKTHEELMSEKPVWQRGLGVLGTIAAIKQMTDQDELAVVALEGWPDEVKFAAARQVCDNALLERIITLTTSEAVRRRAMQNVSDPELLKAYARNRQYGVAWAAIGMIADQEFLAELVLEDSSLEKQKHVLGLIDSNDLLQKIALEASDYRVKNLAVERITDRACLLDMVEASKDPKLRAQCFAALGDDRAVAREVLNTPTFTTQSKYLALQRLDKTALREVYESMAEGEDRRAVLSAQGGFTCPNCGQANLPEPGSGNLACTCPNCQTENHSFMRRQKTEELDSSTESVETWEECTRCGLQKNRHSDLRYTDW
jgi:hypothetical protein